MIILDTNVIAEPMKTNCNYAVRNWLDEQAAESLYLTTISLAELLVGIELLPKGQRKETLHSTCTRVLTQLFGSRILSFDPEAAEAFARIIGKAHKKGQALSVADAQIAAIADVHGFSVATRDTAPFIAAGIKVINPWN